MAMTKNPFNGQLNSNSIFSAIFNMIISQQVFADNIKGTYSELVDKARVDGTLLGDTKLYYATDVLKSRPWLGDSEASNLLNVNRPDSPKCQAITMDVFRQIDITIDNYLSKQAFADEGTFSSFNSVILGWIRETKKVYDTTTYNVFIGNTQSTAQGAKTIDITTATTGLTGLEKARVTALTYARELADILDDMKDITRTYNDYGFLRSYNEDDLEIIIRKDIANEITKLDLPTVYHKDGVDISEKCIKIPARYFGRAVAASDIGSGKIIKADGEYDSTKGTIRAAKEFDYNNVHYFPGDALATSGTYIAVVGGLEATDVYIEDPSKVAVIMHKGSVPYMSAFEVATSFFNPRSLTENHYLTFGHNTLDYLRNYPFLVIKKA